MKLLFSSTITLAILSVATSTETADCWNKCLKKNSRSFCGNRCARRYKKKNGWDDDAAEGKVNKGAVANTLKRYFMAISEEEGSEDEDSEFVTTDTDKKEDRRINSKCKKNSGKDCTEIWTFNFDDDAEDNEEEESEFATTDKDNDGHHHHHGHNKNHGDHGKDGGEDDVIVYGFNDDDAEDNEGEESELVTTDADKNHKRKKNHKKHKNHHKHKNGKGDIVYIWDDDAAEDNEGEESEFATTDADRRYTARSNYNHWRRHNKNKNYWYDDDAAEDNKNEMVQLRGAVKAQI